MTAERVGQRHLAGGEAGQRRQEERLEPAHLRVGQVTRFDPSFAEVLQAVVILPEQGRPPEKPQFRVGLNERIVGDVAARSAANWPVPTPNRGDP